MWLEALCRGATALLLQKGLQPAGCPDTATAPAGRTPYGWVMQADRADLFLTDCTNAVLAVVAALKLQSVQRLDALHVGIVYGFILLSDSEEAWRFAALILSAESEAILARSGFG